MSSDSDDDAPLAKRGNAKGVVNAPAFKKESTPAAKTGVHKLEMKMEDVAGAKGPQGKDQEADVKLKGQEKKPPAAKGRPAVKDEDADQNGTAAPAGKKVKEDGKQPKEKKEYDMPGQTRDPPPETDALRKFYTSLLEQRPESEMAKKWCLMYGLLSRVAAEELVAQLRKAKPVPKSPAKASGRSEGKSMGPAATKARRPPEKAAAAKRQRQAISPPKKTRAKYSDEEDVAESSSGDEEDDDDDDDEPIGRGKKPAPKAGAAAAAKPAAGSKAGAAAGAAAKGRPVARGKDKAFTDGGLDDSDADSDDRPLIQRGKK